MAEWLIGVKVNGGFPNKDYLRIEVVEAPNAEAALAQMKTRPAIWITEFRRSIPAGMAPRLVDYSPRMTDESVSVLRKGNE